MINEDIKVTGQIHAVLTGEDGTIKEEKLVPNMVMTVGKNMIASRLVGTATNIISHMAVGSGGATAPAVPVLEPETFCSKLVAKSQIGTTLSAIIKRATGVEIPCAQCRAAIAALARMDVAAANLDFERAAELRDELMALRKKK